MSMPFGAPPGAFIPQDQPITTSIHNPGPLSWEGEKMFNIYIYDYCYKRGFKKTARELLIEADITHESRPPIDARQGLLFEWWSVFWVLFQAKSNGGGSEDAVLYTQFQNQQANLPRGHARPGPAAPVAPLRQTAGVNGHTQAPPNFAPAPQPNGVAAPHPPTPGAGPNQQQPGPQQPVFNNNMQRPPSMNGPPQPQPPNGQQPQQRPVGTPNHNLPFQSPTMAHSPNVQQGPHPPAGQQPPGAPMGNLSGRGMMPPAGGPQGMVMAQQAQQGAPGPNFAQMGTGRPPSRTNTPQGMIQQSPSMGHRQPMPPPGASNDFAVEAEFRKIPPPALHQLKLDSGIPAEKNDGALSVFDKRKIIEAFRRKAPTPAGGPTTPMMQPPNMPPQQMQQQRPPQLQQPPQPRANKRNSTSPGEEPEVQSADTSPPDRKRARRSPADNMAPKGATPMPYPSTPQMNPGPLQGPPAHLQQQPPPSVMPPQMMRPQGGPMQQPMQMNVNGHVPPPGMAMQGQPGHHQGQQGMGGMQGQMGPPQMGMGMPQNQMGGNYRIPLHQVHTTAPPNQGAPPGGPHRMVPPPPGAAMGTPGNMMPPPSPANAAAALNKDAQKDKMMDVSSPRGPQQQPAQQGGSSQQHGGQPQQGPGGQQISHPGTPGPQGPGQHQQQPGNNGGPPQGGVGGGPGMSSSPANLMGGGPMMLNGDLFLGSNDFNLGVDFDTAGFSMDGGGIDFERDFGSWFNPNDENGMGSLEGMK